MSNQDRSTTARRAPAGYLPCKKCGQFIRYDAPGCRHCAQRAALDRRGGADTWASGARASLVLAIAAAVIVIAGMIDVSLHPWHRADAVIYRVLGAALGAAAAALSRRAARRIRVNPKLRGRGVANWGGIIGALEALSSLGLATAFF